LLLRNSLTLSADDIGPGACAVATTGRCTRVKGSEPKAAAVDLAYLRKSTDAPEFLIYDPREVDKRLGGTLANLSGEEVRARNHRGEVRSFFKNQTPPDQTELRGFFGFWC
jgi:hypothetical protein